MTTMLVTTTLGRRGFGSLLLVTVGAVVFLFQTLPARAATDDPPPPLRVVNVSTSTALNTALSNAMPGDHIVLATGTYSGNRALSRAGTPAAPIVVKSASKHGAMISGGTFTLAGQHTRVDRLRFGGSAFGVVLKADDTGVFRNWFMGPKGVTLTTQQRVRIGYNKFTGGPQSGLSRGHHIFVDIDEGNSVRLPEGGRVYRNDMSSPSGSGASEDYHHIYVGPAGGFANTPSLVDFRIEYNRITDSVRRRYIYTKRAGQLLFNHVTGKGNQTGGIRHGSRGAFSGNRIDNVDRVVINGPDHEVKGNVLTRVRRGMLLESEHRQPGGDYQAADRALLVGNTGTVVVGYLDSGAEFIRPVDGVRIYNHVGSVVMAQQVNTNWEQVPRPDMTAPPTVTLGPGDVGPDAP
jgi:hypothetical protein